MNKITTLLGTYAFHSYAANYLEEDGCKSAVGAPVYEGRYFVAENDEGSLYAVLVCEQVSYDEATRFTAIEFYGYGEGIYKASIQITVKDLEKMVYAGSNWSECLKIIKEFYMPVITAVDLKEEV